MSSGCVPVNCRHISCINVFKVFTVHLLLLLTTSLCTDTIYNKKKSSAANTNKQEKDVEYFPELNYGWMNEQMKTTTKHLQSDENRREKHSISGMLEMFEKCGFLGICLSFFLYLVCFSPPFIPHLSLSLFLPSLSLSPWLISVVVHR